METAEEVTTPSVRTAAGRALADPHPGAPDPTDHPAPPRPLRHVAPVGGPLAHREKEDLVIDILK